MASAKSMNQNFRQSTGNKNHLPIAPHPLALSCLICSEIQPNVSSIWEHQGGIKQQAASTAKDQCWSLKPTYNRNHSWKMQLVSPEMWSSQSQFLAQLLVIAMAGGPPNHARSIEASSSWWCQSISIVPQRIELKQSSSFKVSISTKSIEWLQLQWVTSAKGERLCFALMCLDLPGCPHECTMHPHRIESPAPGMSLLFVMAIPV